MQFMYLNLYCILHKYAFVFLLCENLENETSAFPSSIHFATRYGHPACCINFTVPLTTPPPAAALHVESAPGREVYL